MGCKNVDFYGRDGGRVFRGCRPFEPFKKPPALSNALFRPPSGDPVIAILLVFLCSKFAKTSRFCISYDTIWYGIVSVW